MSESGRALTSHIVTRHELRAQLQAYSREPFLALLEDIIGAKPTHEELVKWARRDPARWAHSIEVFAKLSGFSEKREVTHNFLLGVMNMGDAEIRQALYEMENEEALLLPAPEQQQLASHIESREPDKPGNASLEHWSEWCERPRGAPGRRKKRGA